MVGQVANGDVERLEELNDVFVTDEHHDLVPMHGERAQDLGRGLSSLAVKIDEDVIEHQREHDAAASKIGDERESQTEEHCFPGAATQDVQRERLTSGRTGVPRAGVSFRWSSVRMDSSVIPLSCMALMRRSCSRCSAS